MQAAALTGTILLTHAPWEIRGRYPLPPGTPSLPRLPIIPSCLPATRVLGWEVKTTFSSQHLPKWTLTFSVSANAESIYFGSLSLLCNLSRLSFKLPSNLTVTLLFSIFLLCCPILEAAGFKCHSHGWDPGRAKGKGNFRKNYINIKT